MLLNQPQPFEVGEQLKSDTNTVDMMTSAN